LESARKLTAQLQEHFTEEEIFRIDHYLGKETVQNMLALRFANGIFEPIWNRQFIDHVQITVAESIGIEGRAGYYESAGAIRDIFQNHLLQLVAITAMEPPIDFTADSVRNEKVKVLKALHTPGPKHIVRGQYGGGFVEGEEVAAYRAEQGGAPGGARGLPLRRRGPRGAAGRVRAADPRRDARGRDAVHALGRDRGAVGARRRDRRVLAARSALVPELRGRHVGPGCLGRAA